MSHANKADKLLIKPTAGARPASPCTLGRFIPKARKRGLTPDESQAARTTPPWQRPPTDRPHHSHRRPSERTRTFLVTVVSAHGTAWTSTARSARGRAWRRVFGRRVPAVSAGGVSPCIWLAGYARGRRQSLTRRRRDRTGRVRRPSRRALWQLQEALKQRNPGLGGHCRTRTHRLPSLCCLAAATRAIPNRSRLGGAARREHPATCLGWIRPRLGSRHPRLLRDPTSQHGATYQGASRAVTVTSSLKLSHLACASVQECPLSASWASWSPAR